jgi:hypothetical protein
MNLILFDHPEIRQNLLPFTFTRPVAEIRIGILTIREKWEKHLGLKGSFATENYLSEKFTLTTSTDNLWINGAVCPTPELVQAISKLKVDEALQQGELITGSPFCRYQHSQPPHKKVNPFLVCLR